MVPYFSIQCFNKHRNRYIPIWADTIISMEEIPKCLDGWLKEIHMIKQFLLWKVSNIWRAKGIESLFSSFGREAASLTDAIKASPEPPGPDPLCSPLGLC